MRVLLASVCITVGLLACRASAPSSPRRDAGGDALSEAAAPDGRVGLPDARLPDASVCSSRLECGGECVDVQDDVLHCGACDNSCAAPANARAFCEAGACGFDCAGGTVAMGGECVATTRLLWPPSLGRSTVQNPRFMWILPAGATDGILEICSDRECAMPVITQPVFGTTHQLVDLLPAGRYFWRFTVGDVPSVTWLFTVGAASAPQEAAWGIFPDYDGDRYGDLLVAAPRTSTDVGAAYLYRGARTGTENSPSRVLRAPDGGFFGWASSCAGDLDGDGYADLAIGAPEAFGTEGRVYVYYGSPRGIDARPSQVLSPLDGSLLGGAIAGLGDVNGDGFGDLAVAAQGAGTQPGRVFVYHGGEGGLVTTPVSQSIGAGRYGTAVAALGDVNGDGYADMGIGAPTTNSRLGSVHLFYGGPAGLPDAADEVVEGVDTLGQFGLALAGASDLNGDGFADVAIAAPNALSSQGRVYVYHGSASGLVLPHAKLITGGNPAGGSFGYALAGLNDLGGDGFGDLGIAGWGVDSERGRLVIYNGSATGITVPKAEVDGPFGAGGRFGWALASIGNVDENGLWDLAVGAPGVDDGRGQVYVYRGSSTNGITNAPLVRLIAPAVGAFGRGLASAGQ
ncbi:MAG: FG-GAP-like repeat-containing protein [Myxococcales bacterium]|nr:FG-GAP-like repeat-containing protein [Myxococcales bacterium]